MKTKTCSYHLQVHYDICNLNRGKIELWILTCIVVGVLRILHQN